MTNQAIKLTQLGKSYWDNSGAYQAEHEKLYEELVPGMGEAETVHGELIRSASRLYYDYTNNGNCNAVDVEYYEEEYTCNACGGSGVGGEYDEDEDGDCDDCGGSGFTTEDEVGEITVNNFYQEFINFIHETLSTKVNKKELSKVLADVEAVIIAGAEEYKESYFDDANMSAYDRLTDYVMWYVLNTENSKLNNK